MATGGVVVSEEHITCDICFYVYREPHALPCLHTYCKGCIDQLQNQDKVQCPNCREVCNFNNIRQNFHIQTLIDSHNAKQQELPNKDISHSGKPTPDELQQCQNILKKLKEKGKKVSEISRKIEECIKVISSEEQQQIQEADDLINQAVNKMRNNIHENIKVANANKNRVLTKNKEVYDKVLSDIKSKMNLVGTVIETGDLEKFIANENDIDIVLGKLHNTAPDIPSVTILPGECNNPDTLVKVKVNPIQEVQPGNAQGIDTSLDFSELVANAYRKVKSVKTGVKVQRIKLINQKLYCAVDNGIDVYSTNCELIKEISHSKLLYLCSFVQYDLTGDLVVAGNQGIHQFTIDGDFIRAITSDCNWPFIDVCCLHGRVYGLIYSKIKVFERSGNGWVNDAGADITLVNCSNVDRILATGDCVYLSSARNRFIQVYGTMDGKYQRQLRNPKKRSDVVKWCPYACAVDYHGNVVVCDGDEDIHVCEIGPRGDKWHTVKLQHNDRYFTIKPSDVVLDADGETIWVVTDSYTNELVRFDKFNPVANWLLNAFTGR